MPHTQTKKMFTVNKKTMESYCISGLKKSTHKPKHKSLRKKFTRHTVYKPDDLPPRVNLRPWMTPVENQSGLNSCTANAMAGLYEYLIKKSIAKDVDVSRLFLYYNARRKDLEDEKARAAITDQGSSITAAIDALKESGVCLESIWPYEKKLVNRKPSRKSYRSATVSNTIEAMRVPVDLFYMKACLAQGFPFVFGLQLYASFNKAEFNGGVVPVPKASAAIRATHSNHAMLAVGYSETSQAFIVRNSFGKKWGRKGYCYIPYEYMTDKNFCFDVWTVKTTTSYSLGTDHWRTQDVSNYLAPNDALGPEAYTDDDQGVSIEERVVRETVYPERYGGDSGGDDDDDDDGDNGGGRHGRDDDDDDDGDNGGGGGGGHGRDDDDDENHSGRHGRDDDDDGNHGGGHGRDDHSDGDEDNGGRHGREDDGHYSGVHGDRHDSDDDGHYSGVHGDRHDRDDDGHYSGVHGDHHDRDDDGHYSGVYSGSHNDGHSVDQGREYDGAYGEDRGGDYDQAYGGGQASDYSRAHGEDRGGAYGADQGSDYGGAYGGTYGGGQSIDYGGAYGGSQGDDYGGAYGGGQSNDYGGAYGGAYSGGYGGDYGGAYGGDQSNDYSGAYGGAYGAGQSNNYSGAYGGGYGGDYGGGYGGDYGGGYGGDY